MPFDKLTAPPTECPQCQGEVWDNRAKKRSGQYKPNRPDFSCKDRDNCSWGGNLPKESGGAANGTKPGGSRGGFKTWKELATTFGQCVKIAEHYLTDYPAEAKVRAANCLMIAAQQSGLVLGSPKPTPAPPPPPPPPVEPDPADAGDFGSDDDLPF